jgi:hypothetical protein
MILPTASGPYEIPPHVRLGLYAKYASYGAGIDVDKELAKMALWLEKNPSRRPVKPIRFAEKWLDKCKGANAQPVRPKVAGVANPPFAPPINGAAAASPTQTSDASPLLVAAAAPPSIRSSVGPRSIGDVIGQLRAAIGVRSK